ncbi:hypothetical protein AOQ84DRAFT_357243 [Glonium stellatum]|uniref:Phosphoglycerate mutase family protein n=1 Tax=Glonium stellatum TaxID=574774 RepID=A0A8E2EPY9_9PEZI|nr:hypothetical protein AOQ84DRAFT_357243 [Glonium stellatum]
MAKTSSPTIYMIRHGEKPPKDANGDDVNGLSAQGITRAEGLRQVFGTSSQYNIGYILAEHPKKDGSRARPFETVSPLASELGLVVDTSISRDNASDVAKAAKACTGPGNVLICWEHGQLADIAAAIGVEKYAKKTGLHGKVEYPGDRFDLIWTIKEPYVEIDSVASEAVPGLDDGLANEK